jgi:nucleotide-binding universal stress UspA family protein
VGTVIERILLAVDDSPDALTATRVAVALADRLGARLRAVHVAVDHELSMAVQAASGQSGVEVRTGRSRQSLLSRVAALASRAGVEAETALVAGAVAPTILKAAREWPADLVVIGKSAQGVGGEPYVGSQTRHVLEFAEQPVLVVPPPRRKR